MKQRTTTIIMVVCYILLFIVSFPAFLLLNVDCGFGGGGGLCIILKPIVELDMLNFDPDILLFLLPLALIALVHIVVCAFLQRFGRDFYVAAGFWAFLLLWTAISW